MRWPLVSRGRFDDAQATISELKAKVTEMETEQRRLVNIIMLRHHVQPIFAEPGAPANPAPAPVAAPEVFDPLAREAMTPVTEAIQNGARSARMVCKDVERILDRKHRRATGQDHSYSRVQVPPAQAAVAAELADILNMPKASAQ
jgi:hypothetical protein